MSSKLRCLQNLLIQSKTHAWTRTVTVAERTALLKGDLILPENRHSQKLPFSLENYFKLKLCSYLTIWNQPTTTPFARQYAVFFLPVGKLYNRSGLYISSSCDKCAARSRHGINMRWHQLYVTLILFILSSHEWLQHTNSTEEPTVRTNVSAVQWTQLRWETTHRVVSFPGTVTSDHDLRGVWIPLLPLEQWW